MTVLLIMNSLYLNKEAARIADVTPRQLQSWSDKGVVVPQREAQGGGSKRGYDYINLLEIRICKVLINDMSQGIQLVKRILNGLREEQNALRRWAEDPKTYFTQEWERLGRVYKESPVEDDKEAGRWAFLAAHFHKFFLKSPIVLKKTSGVLFCFFGPSVSRIQFIFPDLYDFESLESYTAMEIIYACMPLYDGSVFLNLGRIKDFIDGALKRVERGNMTDQAIIEEALKVYKIPKELVFSSGIDANTSEAVIVTHGGKKLRHKIGDKAQFELTETDITGKVSDKGK